MDAGFIRKYYPENIRTDVFRTLMNNPIPGIPRIAGLRLQDDHWELTEQYIPGDTLAAYIRRGVFDRKSALSLCLDLCDILERVHALGIVHGDIKPENIIMGADGHLWLIDFDASHFVKEGPGRDTVMMGTPGYAAPERYGFGRSDPRCDIYSIGVLLCVLVTGSHPLYAQPPGLIKNIVDRCTKLNPDDRYQSIAELRAGLKWPMKRREALPPGFRSCRPLNMAAGTIGYAFIIYFCFFFRENSQKYILQESWIFLQLLGIVFISFNYLGVNDRITRKKGWPRVGAVLLEIVIYSLLLLLLFTIINAAVQRML